MLWNSLFTARAGLKIPGAGAWHSAVLTLLWGWLGRAQLCWPGQEPALVCGSALQQMLSEIHGQGFVHCLCLCLLYQGSLGLAWRWQGADVLQLHCGAMPGQISWENSLLGAASLWLSPGAWCSMAGVTSKQHLLTLKQEKPLSLHQLTLICKLGCDKTN